MKEVKIHSNGDVSVWNPEVSAGDDGFVERTPQLDKTLNIGQPAILALPERPSAIEGTTEPKPER